MHHEKEKGDRKDQVRQDLREIFLINGFERNIVSFLSPKQISHVKYGIHSMLSQKMVETDTYIQASFQLRGQDLKSVISLKILVKYLFISQSIKVS